MRTAIARAAGLSPVSDAFSTPRNYFRGPSWEGVLLRHNLFRSQEKTWGKKRLGN